MQRECFAFILNWFNCNFDTPYQLANGFALQKANEAQRAFIIEWLKGRGLDERMPYQYKTLKEQAESTDRLHEDPAAWRYWVVNFPPAHSYFEAMELAMHLVTPLVPAFTHCATPGGGPSYGTPSDIVHVFTNENYHRQFISLDAPVALSAAFSLIAAFDHKKFNVISDALFNFQQLKGIPKTVGFRHLGFFAIIESLLTHMPDPKDPTDSIGRQIKSKFILLNNRMDPKFDFEHWFGEIEPAKLLGKLYTYRSKIAHGAPVEFDSGPLSVLKSTEHVHAVLVALTSNLILHAMKEPQLMTDLKRC